MGFYRQTFPETTITVKLYMLEDHMVLFLQQWKGFGPLGEQGAEGIHVDFKHRFSGIPNSVKQLRCIMKEHHLCCCPRNVAARPPTSNRVKREE